MDHTAVPYAPDREWFTLAITVTPTAPPKPPEKPAENKSATKPSAKPDESGKPAPPQEETEPKTSPKPPPKTFYYTFIVFPAGDYEIGSVNDEPGRNGNESRHLMKLPRPFALLDREITWEELIAFKPMYAGFMQKSDVNADGGRGRRRLVRRGGFLPVAGPAVGLVGRRPVVSGSRDPGQGEVSARTDSRGELGPAELATGTGSRRISTTDGIGVGSG